MLAGEAGSVWEGALETQIRFGNRFGLGLVNRVPEELCVEVSNILQEVVTKTIPKKNKCKKAKWLSKKAL